MSTQFEFRTTDQREIALIEPLWLQLVEHHRLKAIHFKAEIGGMKFSDRRLELLEKAAAFPLQIQLAYAENILTGYCVSSITGDRVGEVDSILVTAAARGHGIGEHFLRQACEWMDGLNVRRKIVSVAEGNEEVFDFYRRFDFYPLANTLMQTLPILAAVKIPDGLIVTSGSLPELELVRPLWEKLTRYDGAVTPRFQAYFEARQFEKRMALVHSNVSDGGVMLLDLVRRMSSPELEGFCLSTVSVDKIGKLESFYLEPGLRDQGAGSLLMQKALNWMESQSSRQKILMAAAGNSRAIAFYARFNFFPRNTILQQIRR